MAFLLNVKEVIKIAELFAPPLIQAQTWQEAQRKFNEVIQQMARMLNQIYTGANIPNSRIATGLSGSKITIGKIQSSDGKTYFDLDGDVIVISDGTHDRVVLGKQNSNYGGTFRDADGNVTVDMGNLVRAMVHNRADILYEVNDVTKTTTGWVDLPDMTFNLTHMKSNIMVYCQNRVLCNSFYGASWGACELQVSIVGHETGGDVIYGSSDQEHPENTLSTIFVFDNVPAGTHTIKARWNIGSSGEYVQSWTSKARELFAMAFGTL